MDNEGTERTASTSSNIQSPIHSYLAFTTSTASQIALKKKLT